MARIPEGYGVQVAPVAIRTGQCLAGFKTAREWVAAPLPIAQGGTGTATPNVVEGTDISITKSWPNEAVNCTLTYNWRHGWSTTPGK